MAKNVAIPVESRKRVPVDDYTHLMSCDVLEKDVNTNGVLLPPAAKRFRKPTNGAHEAAGKLQRGRYSDTDGATRRRSFGFKDIFNPGGNGESGNEKALISPNRNSSGCFQTSSVDSCAAVLASVDRRAHARALLFDANALVERIILPMAIPWSQSDDGLVYAVARDIDELSGIISAGEEESSIFWERRRRLGGKVSARRSEDPGVIEFRLSSEPSMIRTRFPPPFLSPSFKKENASHFGELSLRSFLEMRARSQMNDELSSELSKASLVSLNLASTSSRSTLFDSAKETGRRPLLLSALLPLERTSRPLADGVAGKFGTYDCRYGKPKEDEGSRRLRASRARKVWTKRAAFSSTPVSMLTGEPMLPGTWQRPREVKVGIKINGALLSAASVVNFRSENQLVYRQGIIDSAIGAAYKQSSTQASTAGRRLQCRLEIEWFLKSSFQKMRTTSEAQAPQTLVIKPTKNIKTSIALSFRHPRIDCFTAEDGLLHAVCVQAGTMTILPPKTMSRVLDLTASERKICTICWSRSNEQVESDGSSLLRCKGCDLVVHRQCYGVHRPNPHWMCDTCDRLVADHSQPVEDKTHLKKIRWGVRCAYCPTTGSSLVCHEDGGMVHNVCRDWGQKGHTRPCALCGAYSNVLARCAAKNCHVDFHPLCALMASNAADLYQHKSDASSDAASRDEFLCTQYRLARLEVGSRASDKVEAVYVVFCGLHNPDRQDDFYGLPAGCRGLVMRIPPLPFR